MSKPRVVIYSRVSTEEQARHGFSLRDQQDKLRRYCESNGWTIEAHYEDEQSAKSFKRRGYERFVSDLKSKRISPTIFLTTRPDRFSRDLREALEQIKFLESHNIEVRHIEGSRYDPDIPETFIPHMLGYSISQVENLRRGKNTREGLRRAKKEGRWVGTAPKGYSWNNKLLIKNDDAPLIVELFSEVSKGLETVDSVRLRLRKRGLQIGKNQVYNILRNPVYVGKIEIPPYGNEVGQIVEGLHEPLISEDLFESVQKILEPNSRKGTKPRKLHQELPLRGYLICPVCGRNLTGSTSNNGRGSTHSYYHCQSKYGCKFRCHSDEINNAFKKELIRIQVPPEVVSLYLEVMKDLMRERGQTKDGEIKQLEIQLENLKEKVDLIDDKFLNEQIDSEGYKRISQRLQSDIKERKVRLEELSKESDDFDKYVEFGAILVSNIASIYSKADVSIKKRIIGSILSEKMIFDGEKYRTIKFNGAFKLFGLKDRELHHSKKEKVSISADQSTKALPLGLEPRTL